jgi:N-methylhydantoinase B
MKRTADVLQGALAKALPGRIAAANSGQVAVMFVGGRHRDTNKSFVTFIAVPFPGGMGARPSKDGIDVIATDLNNEMNFPIEAAEMAYPVRFDYVHLWPDSGGPGRYRGGLGYTARAVWLGDRAVLSHRRDRHDFAPWGLQGGQPAPRCRTDLVRRDGRIEALPSKILTYLEEGDALEIYTTGGGGHGDPLGRDPAAVLEDVLDGRVSPEAARRDYGIVLDPAGRAVDAATTEALRRSMRAGNGR